MEQYILFYSNNCLHCKEFANYLYKSPLYENFKKVCVDNNPSIPSKISSVPTIIVPRMPKPLIGKEAFHWLRGMNMQVIKEKESQNQNNNTGQEKKADGQVSDPTNLSYSMGDVSAYSNTMGGYSDNFSFLGDNNPQEHSFSFLGGGNGQIKTPDDGNVNKSEKSSAMDSAYERLISQRNNDMPVQRGRV